VGSRGLRGGWLAENLITKGGYGLVVDMVLRLAGSVLGGGAILALVSPPIGMFPMVAVGFVAAGGVIVVQRLCWRRAA